MNEDANEVNKGLLKEIKVILDDVEQIGKFNEQISAVCQEITTKIVKNLKITDKTMVLEDSKGETMIGSGGFIVRKNYSGRIKSKILSDLAPLEFYEVLKQLIPRLRNDVRDQKEIRETISNKLFKVSELFS